MIRRDRVDTVRAGIISYAVKKRGRLLPSFFHVKQRICECFLCGETEKSDYL